jgi:hypothetical protein
MTLHLANGLLGGVIVLVLNFGLIAVSRLLSRRSDRQQDGEAR